MLDRRLRHFAIFFNVGAVKVDHVIRAFETEPNRPEELSGAVYFRELSYFESFFFLCFAVTFHFTLSFV